MDIAAGKALVTPFYTALTLPGERDVGALIEGATTGDWASFGGDAQPPKSREAFIGQVRGFGKLIPDLRWEVQEVLPVGDRIVVRSRVTGTPVGPLFGVDGRGRSFDILAIDIHTVVDGKLARAWHVEDWATALRQLTGG